jgi:hypothetical protein
LSSDLKTIKSFCQMISKRSCFLRSKFLNFFSRLRFLFRAYFVHTKVTFNSDRRYYKKLDNDWWEWSTNDVIVWFSFSKRKRFHLFRFHSSFSSISMLVFFDFNACLRRILSDHHFLLVSLKLLCDLSVKTVCNERFMHSWECFVSYY